MAATWVEADDERGSQRGQACHAGRVLESLITVLIGINVQDPEVSRALNDLKANGGFTQYVEAKDASPKTLARVAGFISKSISSQSQSIGSGAASQPIVF